MIFFNKESIKVGESMQRKPEPYAIESYTDIQNNEISQNVLLREGKAVVSFERKVLLN